MILQFVSHRIGARSAVSVAKRMKKNLSRSVVAAMKKIMKSSKIKGAEMDAEQKTKTRLETRKAIQRGLLIKMSCEVCGEQKVHAHHLDYNDPLNVKWLCSKHRIEAHHGKQGVVETVNIFKDAEVCPKCSYTWVPRAKQPKLCPKCKKRLRYGVICKK